MLVLVVGGIRHSEETFPVSKTVLCQTNFKLQSLDSVGIFFSFLLIRIMWEHEITFSRLM